MPKQRTMIQRMIRRTGFVFAASLIIMLVSVLMLTVFYSVVEGDQTEYVGYENRRTIFDWFYFTVITTRTIGFGDITPKTGLGKLGTVFNALLPASLFFGASLVVLEGFFRWLEVAYRRHVMSKLKGHHIVVADEELMESIVQELSLENIPFVCVNPTRFEDLPPRLQESLDDSSYYAGDATRDEVLESVNIRQANAILIATNDDNVNLYVLVTAKGLAPSVKTIVRVNRLETESKFRSVGADQLLPAGTMLGRMLSQAAVSPVAMDFLVCLQTGTAEPNLEEVTIPASHAGRSVRDAVRSPVALYRNGRYEFAIDNQTVQEGDIVLRIASRQ